MTHLRSEVVYGSALSVGRTRNGETGPPKLLWELAAVHAVRGEREVAVTWLQRAHQAGWRWVGIIALDPILDPLRDAPALQTVLADMRAEVEAMRSSLEDGTGS